MDTEISEATVIKMLAAYKANPTIAAEDLLGEDLAPHQDLILDNAFKYLFLFITCCRGMGKTRIGADIGWLKAILIPGTKVLFVGPCFRNAKLIFQEAESVFNKSEFLQEVSNKPVHTADIWHFTLKNGSQLAAMPLASDSSGSIRGYRAHVMIVDELPHIPEHVLAAVLTPMMATIRNPMENVKRIKKIKEMYEKGELDSLDLSSERNQLVTLTSAYFKFNHAYKRLINYKDAIDDSKERGEKPDYNILSFNYKDSPDGFMDTKNIELARKSLPAKIYSMEYLSIWSDDSDGFYPRSLIDGCVSIGSSLFSPELFGNLADRYILGIDIARTVDNMSINVIKLDGIFSRSVRIITMNRCTFPDMARKIFKTIADYVNVVGIAMDLRGGGQAIEDLLKEPTFIPEGSLPILKIDEQDETKQGLRILNMINCDPRWYMEANFGLKAEMQRKQILFPSLPGSKDYKDVDIAEVVDDNLLEFNNLYDEMQSIVISETSQTNQLHFDAKSKRAKTDRFSAFLLASMLAFKFKNIKIESNVSELPVGFFVS